MHLHARYRLLHHLHRLISFSPWTAVILGLLLQADQKHAVAYRQSLIGSWRLLSRRHRMISRLDRPSSCAILLSAPDIEVPVSFNFDFKLNVS